MNDSQEATVSKISHESGNILVAGGLGTVVLSLLGVYIWHSATASVPYYSSTRDFSDTQGYQQWYYQDSTGNNLSFSPLRNEWHAMEPHLTLSPTGGHPGEFRDAVRRWIVPEEGLLMLRAHTYDLDPMCGDGVQVSVRKEGKILWPSSGIPQTINNGNTVGYNITLSDIPVSAGEVLEFVINKGGGDNWCDSTHFSTDIVFYPNLVTE